MIDPEPFVSELETSGSVLVEHMFESSLMDRCRAGLARAIDMEAAYHGTTDYPDYGMVQCCAMYDTVFVELLGVDCLVRPLERVLGEGCIVYAYTSSSIPPKGTNFAARIHVDCPRLIPGYLTNMGAVVVVDEFTEANGATWFLPGSHTRADAPTPEEFFANARRLVAPAGSVWFVNPTLWHAAGTNRTSRWRHSFGINMCRPYMKQRFDLPRLLQGVDLDGVSPKAYQKLGFLSRPPSTLDEYYVPAEQRTFRQPYE